MLNARGTVVDQRRLNSQHHLFKEEFGGLLNPHISLEKDNLKIADVGTGTW